MKVLIIDDIHQVFLDRLRRAEIPFDYRPDMDLKEAMGVIGSYAGLVIRSKFRVGKELIDRGVRLAFIARAGAGLDNIEEEYAASKGIAMLNAPEGNRQAVAEHMVGMLLSLLNNLRNAHSEVAAGLWEREQNRGLQLSGRTVALIGYGHNGQAMARCLSGFGVNILAYDKYKTGFGSASIREVGLDEIFEQADIVSLHLPLTPETRHLVNPEFLGRFRKSIFFLNGSRGEIVDIPSVLEGLHSGRIRGAAFDVLPVERFPELAQQPWFADLIASPRVLLSPHVAGWTVESYYDIASVLAEKVISFYKNQQSQ